ncbi:MAG TPA: hypothetical protein VMP42_06315, partial [Actinomycetota bacterium]|nr:hypothetical protein [Actinomycetota bacterium]
EFPGVESKEIVGPRANLPLHGDIRLWTDDRMESGSESALELEEGEGGLVFPIEGGVVVDGNELRPEAMAILPPAEGSRKVTVSSPEGARSLRVVFGPGYGLALRST